MNVDPNTILATSHGRRSIDTLALYDQSKANWDCMSMSTSFSIEHWGHAMPPAHKRMLIPDTYRCQLHRRLHPPRIRQRCNRDPWRTGPPCKPRTVARKLGCRDLWHSRAGRRLARRPQARAPVCSRCCRGRQAGETRPAVLFAWPVPAGPQGLVVVIDCGPGGRTVRDQSRKGRGVQGHCAGVYPLAFTAAGCRGRLDCGGSEKCFGQGSRGERSSAIGNPGCVSIELVVLHG